MDPVATTVFDIGSVNAAQQQAGSPASVQTFDIARFEQALQAPAAGEAAQGVRAPTEAVGAATWQSLLAPLDKLNAQAAGVRANAFELIARRDELSPADLLALQVEVHKFSFHSQLTSNIADKSSKGIQELFRQKA